MLPLNNSLEHEPRRRQALLVISRVQRTFPKQQKRRSRLYELSGPESLLNWVPLPLHNIGGDGEQVTPNAVRIYVTDE